MDIWKEALKRGAQVDENSVIYKGVKFVKTDCSIEVFTTKTDFYEPMDFEYVKLFYEIGFDQAISTYLYDKYTDNINRLNVTIRDEIGGRKNTRRYNYLKKKRDEIIKKLTDERNTREATE